MTIFHILKYSVTPNGHFIGFNWSDLPHWFANEFGNRSLDLHTDEELVKLFKEMLLALDDDDISRT